MAKDSPELEKILSDLDSMGKELDNLQSQISKHMANRVEVLRKMADLVNSEKPGSTRTKRTKKSVKKRVAAKKSTKKVRKKTVKKTVAKRSAKIITRKRKKASIKRESNK